MTSELPAVAAATPINGCSHQLCQFLLRRDNAILQTKADWRFLFSSISRQRWLLLLLFLTELPLLALPVACTAAAWPMRCCWWYCFHCHSHFDRVSEACSRQGFHGLLQRQSEPDGTIDESQTNPGTLLAMHINSSEHL
jgi:hypothetical protein